MSAEALRWLSVRIRKRRRWLSRTDGRVDRRISEVIRTAHQPDCAWRGGARELRSSRRS